MKITLPLPATTTCRFVVAVEHLPFDPASFIPWRIGAPYRRAAITAVSTGMLTVTHHPTPWRPADTGLTDDDRRRLRRTKQHLVVTSTAPPHRLPTAAQVARAAARALAEESGGVLIDPLTATTVVSCGRCSGEPTHFRLTDDWLSWDVQAHDAATCPPWDPADLGACDCLRVTSRGLRRFALPEITLDGASCAHNLCATSLLRTVAGRLVTDHLSYLAAHPGAATRTIDDLLRIHPSDQPDGGLPFVVRLTPYDAEAGELGRTGGIRRLKIGPAPGAGRITCLKVGPPSGFTGSLNSWLCATHSARPTPVTRSQATITSPTPAPRTVTTAKPSGTPAREATTAAAASGTVTPLASATGRPAAAGASGAVAGACSGAAGASGAVTGACSGAAGASGAVTGVSSGAPVAVTPLSLLSPETCSALPAGAPDSPAAATALATDARTTDPEEASGRSATVPAEADPGSSAIVTAITSAGSAGRKTTAGGEQAAEVVRERGGRVADAVHGREGRVADAVDGREGRVADIVDGWGGRRAEAAISLDGSAAEIATDSHFQGTSPTASQGTSPTARPSRSRSHHHPRSRALAPSTHETLDYGDFDVAKAA